MGELMSVSKPYRWSSWRHGWGLLIGMTVGLLGCAEGEPDYDVLIRGGNLYDGVEVEARRLDVGLRGDRIAAIGDLASSTATTEIDAAGLAVAPGFINMLSWATTSLLVDGTGLGDLVQGVTLEVFGEGGSMGPLNDEMLALLEAEKVYDYTVDWRTLGEYLESLECRGVSPNVASFVGATTVRTHVLEYDDRAPNESELDQMRALVREAMMEGALGVGSSLIYPPAFFASTEELIELNKVASEHGGAYISHLRSEGNQWLEAINELIQIAEEADIRAEIYHLKAAGEANWNKMDAAIELIEGARARGLEITTDMYLYTAGATGLTATLPPWVQEGGHGAMIQRLRDPAVRAKVEAEMRSSSADWENMLQIAGDASRVLLIGFKNPSLAELTGQTLNEVALARGTSPEATAIDLIVEDDTRVETVYFMMSENNVKRQIALPYMRFGSDAGSMAPRPPFTDRSNHPRAYGNVARLLGHYVRDQGVISLGEAVRRLTSLPAETLRIRDRGRLAVGAFADVVIFDPSKIQDHATFEDPHQLSTGVNHVIVNGQWTLRDGEPTGTLAGRVVRGPGWGGWDATDAGNPPPVDCSGRLDPSAAADE